MTDRAVGLHFEQNARFYIPSVQCDWYDEDEWYAILTFGNRNCDPLVGVTLTLKGRWVKRVGDWLYGRRTG